MHGGAGTPSPRVFSEVLILVDFKSVAPEVLVLKGLQCDFSELVILKRLGARNGLRAALARSNRSSAGVCLQLTPNLSTLFPCIAMIMLWLFEYTVEIDSKSGRQAT
jgi:hypothetical protein